VAESGYIVFNFNSRVLTCN